MTNDIVKVNEEFIDDLAQLSGSAIKLFLVLKQKAGNVDRKDIWVSCGYDELMNKTGITHKKTMRLAIINLAEHGWIKDFKRGYFNKGENKKMTNQYLISMEKTDMSDNPNWYMKLRNW